MNQVKFRLKTVLKTLIYLQLAAIAVSIPFYTADLTLAGAFMGKFAIYVFWLIAVPGILLRFGARGRLKQFQQILSYNRRYLGIWMFFLVLTHYLWSRAFGYIAFGFPDPDTFPAFMRFGMAALVLLIPLALTSNNWSVKKMGPYWKVLHYLTYPIMLLIILHTATQGNDFRIAGLDFGLDYTLSYSVPSLAILLLQIGSYAYKNTGKSISENRLFDLSIKKVTPNTNKAVTVEFAIPAELKDKFLYLPGQHVNLHLSVAGKTLNRSYSVCFFDLQTGSLAIGVKRDGEGLVSNHINDTFQVGQKITVSLPFGDFYQDSWLRDGETVYLWAAGSGITPIISILRHILENKPEIKVELIYANRDEQSIMFGPELDTLEKRYAGRLKLTHVLSNPKTVLNSPSILTGRVDSHRVAQLVRGGTHYICGPEGFIDTIEEALQGIGSIDQGNIHIERFTKKMEGEILYSTGQTVPASGDYICLDCGYVQYLEAGQQFPVCPVCLAGQNDDQYEFWRAV